MRQSVWVQSKSQVLVAEKRPSRLGVAVGARIDMVISLEPSDHAQLRRQDWTIGSQPTDPTGRESES